jgi:hypothetical protein
MWRTHVLNSHSTNNPSKISTIAGDRPRTAGPQAFGSAHRVPPENRIWLAGRGSS